MPSLHLGGQKLENSKLIFQHMKFLNLWCQILKLLLDDFSRGKSVRKWLYRQNLIFFKNKSCLRLNSWIYFINIMISWCIRLESGSCYQTYMFFLDSIADDLKFWNFSFFFRRTVNIAITKIIWLDVLFHFSSIVAIYKNRFWCIVELPQTRHRINDAVNIYNWNI